MSRIRILVEGQTEETFVNDVLSPHLNQIGIYPYALLFRRRGGSFRYEKCQKVILDALKQDKSAQITTMVDFYGMPRDWPGRNESQSCRDYQDKARRVEQALRDDIIAQMGKSWNPARFIPYVQMHEFEALLFSSPVKLAESLGDERLSSAFLTIRNEFPTPEEINDNYETCPSRRIEGVFHSFKKTIDGITAAGRIGLERMRQECPHFDEWITKLENIGNR